MVVVHHLNESRSQRIVWLLEELGAPYELKHHSRDATTRLAPPSLEAVHPLGKAPMITDNGRTIIESGAIVDYLVRHYGKGKLQPAADSAQYDEYVQWLHYAEGSAMLPLMLDLYTAALGEGAAPLAPRITSELARHIGYIDSSLKGKQFLLGDTFSGADVQLSFVGEFAQRRGLTNYQNLNAWLERLHARPAYKRSVEKGGAYSLSFLQK
jgi:glutathione S-transferase